MAHRRCCMVSSPKMALKVCVVLAVHVMMMDDNDDDDDVQDSSDDNDENNRCWLPDA